MCRTCADGARSPRTKHPPAILRRWVAVRDAQSVHILRDRFTGSQTTGNTKELQGRLARIWTAEPRFQLMISPVPVCPCAHLHKPNHPYYQSSITQSYVSNMHQFSHILLRFALAATAPHAKLRRNTGGLVCGDPVDGTQVKDAAIPKTR